MNQIVNPFSLRGVVAAMLLVPLFIGTLHPDIHVPAIFRIDLGVHWTAFFMIAAALLMLLPRRPGKVLAVCLALAVLLEASQLFIDGRQADIADMCANLVGVVRAIVLIKSMRIYGVVKTLPDKTASPLP